MSTSIEQRVVQMKFDNKQFESGVAQTMSTLDKFKAKLNFKGAVQGVDEVSKAVNNLNLNPIGDQADKVGIRFDALAVVAVTALQRITNAAITAGSQIAKSLTIQPVTQGFQEYELKMGSVQTIMNSTGESLETVNKYLEELNTYSDRTIYSFKDMTSNIGKFTNAGVKLEDAVKAIQGISNEAALSGANANEASRAMYNFSQALASGAVRLIDWKSIENANMATVEFKNELLKTASAIGTVIEKDGKYISTTTDLNGKVSDAFTATMGFNDSLSAQWMTTEVLTQTLARYSDETTELGKRAFAAATEIKTFSMLMDTLQESVGSGWAQTWEIIFGDFEEAKQLWTGIGNVVGNFIDVESDARNELLKGWKDLGGRTLAIDTIASAFNNLIDVLAALRSGLEDIFPPITARQLYDATQAVKNFIDSIKLSDEAINTLRVAFKALLLPVKAVTTAFQIGIYWAGKAIQQIFKLVDSIIALPSKIGTLEDPFRKLFGDERYNRIAESLSKIVKGLGEALGVAGKGAGELMKSFVDLAKTSAGQTFEKLANAMTPLASWILDRIVDGIEAIANADYSKITGWATTAVDALRTGFSGLVELLQNGVEVVKNFFAQFEITSPIDILKGLFGALNSFREGMWEFIKSLGGEEIIEAVANAGGRLSDVVMNLFNALKNVISVLTPAKILVFAFGTSLVWTVTQVGNAFKSLSGIGESVSGMFKSVGGVFDALKERIQPNKMKEASTAIIGFAAALTILSGAMYIISRIEADRLWASFGAMSALIGVFGAFAGTMMGLIRVAAKTPEMAKNLKSLSLSLIGMSTSIAILAAALYAVSKIDIEGIGGKLLIMAAAIATMVGASIIMGKHSQDLAKSAIFMIAFSGSMLLIARSLKALGEVDLTGSAANVTIILGVMAALAVVSRLMTRTTTSISGDRKRKSSMQGLTGLILDILLLAAALKLLSGMDTANLITGLVNMIPVFAALLAVAGIIRVAGKESSKMGTQMLAITAAMVVLSVAIERIGSIEQATIDRAMGVIVPVMAMFSALTLLAKLGKSSTVKMGSTFLGMASAILILSLAIDYLGNLSLKQVVQGTAVVAAILAMFGALMVASSVVGSAKGTITAMTIAIGLLVASLAILTLLDFKELMGSAVALGTVLLALGGAMKLMSGLKISSAMGSILVLLAAVSMLGLTFGYLRDMDPNVVLAQATGIAEVLVALGVAMTLLRRQRGQNDVALATVGIMAIILAEMTAVMLALSLMPAGENLITKATAMSEILLALSASMVILGKSGNLGDWGTIGKTLTIMAALLIGATAVTAILNALPLNEGLIEKATSLSILMLAMTGAMAIISKLGMGLSMLGSVGLAAIGGALVAEGIILSVIAIIELIGFLFDKFEGLESSLTKAEEILPRIGTVIGEFLGSFIGGLVGGTVGTAIETFGASLSKFAENVEGFLSLKVNQETVDSIGRLAQVATTITGATFLDAITRFGQGASSLEEFGSQLSAFGPYFADFANSIANIPQDAVNASATCLEAISKVLANIPTDGGLMGMIFGKQDLTAFGTGLSSIALGMASYASALSGSNIDASTLETTNQVADMLVTLANKVPKTGGLVSFLGAHDIGKFGEQIVQFAGGLRDFMNSLNGVYIDKGKLDAVSEYGTMLVNLANKVPKTGALVTFLGGHDIGAFGTQLEQFADGLVKFLNKINLVSINQDQVEAAKAAGDTMVALAERVPKSGALLDFFGNKDLGVFGQQIGAFGQGLAGFFTAINATGLDEGKVQLAKSAGIAFVDIADELGSNTGISTWFEGTSLSVFGEQIKKLGEHLASYYESVATVSWEVVNSSVDALNRILEIVPQMADITTTDTAGFTKFLRALANSGVKEFAQTFQDAEDELRQGVIDGINNAFSSVRNNMEMYGENYTVLIDALVAGINAHTDRLVIKAKEVCDRFVEAVNNQWQQLENAGSFIVTSMILGIEQSNEKLTRTVRSMMEGVVATMNQSLGITGGYSTKFQNAGQSCVNGLIRGMDSGRGGLYERVASLGNGMIQSLRNAVGWHSPWETTIEAGKDLVGGLYEGVTENIPTALDSVDILGENVLDQLGDAFDIQGDTSLEGFDIGSILNTGIGEGILETDSAYTAASTVANGILDIFKDRFSDIGDAMSVLDKEFELWATKNPVGSYSDGVNTYTFGQGAYTQKQFELLNNKLALQAEKVNMANASYQANLAKFGQNATATREAYSSYLEAQIDMANMAQSMQELQRSNQQTFLQYAQVLEGIYDDMKLQGFSDEDIKQAAANQTGWTDMSKVANTNMEQLIETYTSQATSVESLVTEAMNSATQKATATAKTSGTQVVQSFSQGVQEASPQVSGAVSDMVKQATDESSQTMNQKGNDASKSWFEGLIDGASSKLTEWGNMMTGAATQGDEAFRAAAGIQSPSTVMYQNGVYLIQGLVDGITQSTPMAVNSASMVATQTLTVFTNQVTQYPAVGQQMMAGLASGISAGASSVISAATTVATQAIMAARSVLGIHSPSREYYEIGQQMDQGLANGIIDGTSIVANAVQKMLSGVQNAVNDSNLYISPVIEDTGNRGAWVREYGSGKTTISRPTDTAQLIQWDANGNLIPVGYQHAGKNKEGSYHYIAKSLEEAYEIRDVYMKEDFKQVMEDLGAQQGLFQGTVEELRDAIENLSRSQPVSFTQNNYSPESLSTGQIYRDTKSVIGKVSSHLSPTGTGVSGGKITLSKVSGLTSSDRISTTVNNVVNVKRYT